MLLAMKFVALFLCLLSCAACVGHGVQPREKKPAAIMVPSGTQIPTLGLAFDVSYDPSTDGVIPTYRIVNVGITNNSLEVIPLDPYTDRWRVVDRAGRKHDATVSLRRENPAVWAQLPVGLKKLIQYPLLLPIGTTQSLDILFSDRINLNEFREIIFESTGLGREIRIYPREQ